MANGSSRTTRHRPPSGQVASSAANATSQLGDGFGDGEKDIADQDTVRRFGPVVLVPQQITCALPPVTCACLRFLTSPSGITIRSRNHPAGRHDGTSSRQ